jgi:hypothetical protein
VLDAVKDEENPWNNTYMVQARIGASLDWWPKFCGAKTEKKKPEKDFRERPA